MGRVVQECFEKKGGGGGAAPSAPPQNPPMYTLSGATWLTAMIVPKLYLSIPIFFY